MARVCIHESIAVNTAIVNGIPESGTWGNVFVIEEGVSHETQLHLCAGWVGWKHLKVYPRDTKLCCGTFEAGERIAVILLKRSCSGWPDVYTLENLREDLEFRAVKLRLAV